MTTNNLFRGLSLLLSTQIVKRYGLDTFYYGIINETCQELLKLLDLEYVSSLFSEINIILLIISIFTIFSFYVAYTYFKTYITKYETMNKSKVNIYDIDDLGVIYEYIIKHPNFFANMKELNIGNLSAILSTIIKDKNNTSYFLESIKNCKLPPDGVIIDFNDNNFKCKGKIYWKENITQVNREFEGTKYVDNVNIPYCCIVMDCKSSQNILDYIKYIKDYINKDTYYVTKYYVKILADEKGGIKNSIQTIYDGKHPNFDELEKKFINTFFHEKKSQLWNFIKGIHFEPEKFIDRGQVPRCGIIAYGPPGTGKSSFAYRIARSLNRHIVSVDINSIKTRYDLFQIIKNPVIDSLSKETKEVVFIFDEFDLVLKKLVDKEKRRQSILFHQQTDSKIDTVSSSKEQKTESESTEISIHDILEILQGPVPIEGMIVIATTNDLDAIKEMNPAIVRPGRLTPVYFGNPTKEILNEISMFYYSQSLDLDIEGRISQPTSSIIEIALQNSNFESFKSELLEII
ncbi:MAG: hypothetical protein CMF62_00760 [Magnetococcales bacterium]|nr:hypothetical protein [Magnetococcales bacterium]|tara:strand:+ start:2488 stop:4038 length:1551 start_codon:yes stop_codon:yes gene_type:complete